MNYSQFTLDDFLEDTYFKEWVYNPTAQSVQFWEEFVMYHPEKLEVIEHAQAMLLSILDDISQNYPEDVQIDKMWDSIQNEVQGGRKDNQKIWGITPFRFIAAAAMALIVLAWVDKI